MADRIALPARKGTITYPAEHIEDIVDSFDDLPAGEAVVVDDAQDTETKARDRAQKVKDLIAADPHNLTVKAHSVETEDGTFIPAVSLPLGR